ncbi:hypothetical protein T06_814 [Trichinella sp. T6]|nr:hypothetical protein T06_814 [Trichinella sp. T6]
MNGEHLLVPFRTDWKNVQLLTAGEIFLPGFRSLEHSLFCILKTDW